MEAIFVCIFYRPAMIVANGLDYGQSEPIALGLVAGPVKTVEHQSAVERRVVRRIGHDETVAAAIAVMAH